MAILSVGDFINYCVDWIEANQTSIADAWAGPGEGWEDWARVELRRYITKQDIASDLGGTANVYKSKKWACDFLLNDQLTDNVSQKVIVEFKAQSKGRIKDFRNDFEKTVGKLGEVAGGFGEAERVAAALFFTKDVGKSVYSAATTLAAANLSDALGKYNRVFFSTRYNPWRLTPGQFSSRLRTGAEEPKKAEEEDDVFELGLVWTSLGPATPPEEQDVEESSSDVEESSSLEQTEAPQPEKKRARK